MNKFSPNSEKKFEKKFKKKFKTSCHFREKCKNCLTLKHSQILKK